MSKLLIRYYENKFPEVDDVVLGRVCRISEYGFKITLPEYRDMDAFLNFRDASKKKKLAAIKQEVKQNCEYTFVVINVDEDKNYVELARKDQSAEDDKEFYAYYKLYKHCMKIMSQYFWVTSCNDAEAQEEFMTRTFWKVERDELFTLLKDIQFGKEDCKTYFDIEDDEKELLLDAIKTGMKDSSCSIDVELKIICTDINGRDSIINYLKRVEEIVKAPIFVKSPPLYTFRVTGVIEDGYEEECNKIRKNINSVRTDNITCADSFAKLSC